MLHSEVAGTDPGGSFFGSREILPVSDHLLRDTLCLCLRTFLYLRPHDEIRRYILRGHSLTQLSPHGRRTFDGEIGDTALHLAARYKDIEMVQMLLSKGASLSIKNKAGEMLCVLSDAWPCRMLFPWRPWSTQKDNNL